MKHLKNCISRQYADIAEAKLRQQTDIIHAQTQAQKTVIASQAMATKRAQEGYTYQQERGFDVAERSRRMRRSVNSPIWALDLGQWQALAVRSAGWSAG